MSSGRQAPTTPRSSTKAFQIFGCQPSPTFAATPLTPAEESWLIRAGVGYSLGGNRAALQRLHGQYSPFIAKARSANAIRVALDDSLSGVAGAADFAALSTGADTFVAGSAVYGAESAAAAIDELRALAAGHAH